MIPFAPFISHACGMFIGWLVVRFGFNVDADQQKSASEFLSMVVTFVVLWIGTHLGMSWKINPNNAVSPGAVKQGVAEKQERAEVRAAIKREQLTEPNPLEEPPPESRKHWSPPSEHVPGPERGPDV